MNKLNQVLLTIFLLICIGLGGVLFWKNLPSHVTSIVECLKMDSDYARTACLNTFFIEKENGSWKASSGQYTINEFAKQIKSRFPATKKIDDELLVWTVITQYPEYASWVNMPSWKYLKIRDDKETLKQPWENIGIPWNYQVFKKRAELAGWTEKDIKARARKIADEYKEFALGAGFSEKSIDSYISIWNLPPSL